VTDSALGRFLKSVTVSVNKLLTLGAAGAGARLVTCATTGAALPASTATDRDVHRHHERIGRIIGS
jgi:hypothetical protein